MSRGLKQSSVVLTLAFFAPFLYLSRAFSQTPEPPPLARNHALAWRANIDSISILTCRYRVWTGRATSVSEARSFLIRPCEARDCQFTHQTASGRLYLRDGYMMLFSKEGNDEFVWLRDDAKVRLRCWQRTDDGQAFAHADLATAAGGDGWSTWFESAYVPHRVLATGDGVAGRPDYEILVEPVARGWRITDVQVHRKVRFGKHVCDCVRLAVSNSGATGTVEYYFDAQRPGLLWGIVRPLEDGSRAIAEVREVAYLSTGQWYPTRVISYFTSGIRDQLLYEGHVTALEVVELEEEAPPLSQFEVRIRGTVWLMDLGHGAFLRKQLLRLRADELATWAARLRRRYETPSTTVATAQKQKAPADGRLTSGSHSRSFGFYAVLGACAIAAAAGLLWRAAAARRRC